MVHSTPTRARFAGTLLLGILALSYPAAAQTAPQGIDLRSNFETIAVKVPCAPSDFPAVSGNLEYREKGATEWKPAHRLARIAGHRLAGSIFRLKPGTEYEVRATVLRPDRPSEDVRVSSISTRSDQFPARSGRTVHVSIKTGDDANDGSAGRPAQTIQRAVELAAPGDVVLVAPGVYREQVFIGEANSGAPDAYIHYKASGPGVILDGSHPILAKDKQAQGWSDDDWKPSAIGEGVFEARIPAGTEKSDWLFIDGKRLFTYETPDEFLARPADALPTVTKGIYGETLGAFHWDGAKGKLYARPRKGEDPDALTVHLPVLQNGFTLQGAHHVLIDGFEIRYYGRSQSGIATYKNGQSLNGVSRGVFVRDSSQCVVQNCLILGCFAPIRVVKSSQITSQDNYVIDNLGFALPWGGTPYGAYHSPKGSKFAHSQGIIYEGAYEDAVIRHNVVQGFVDGINICDGSGTRYENYDIYGNVVTEARDDALEMDCDDINMKVWGNVFFENHTALSFSGCEVGPAFVFNNLSFRYFNESYKVHGRKASGPMFIYNNTHSALYKGGAEVGKGLELSFTPTTAGEDYLVLKNNVFEGTQAARVEEGRPPMPEESFKSDHNCWNGPLQIAGRRKADGVYASISEYTALYPHRDRNSIMADPQFENRDQSDFRLKKESPCVDAGTPISNITDGFAGKAPDMGAWEAGAPSRTLQRAVEKLASVRSGELLRRMRGQTSPK